MLAGVGVCVRLLVSSWSGTVGRAREWVRVRYLLEQYGGIRWSSMMAAKCLMDVMDDVDGGG